MKWLQDLCYYYNEYVTIVDSSFSYEFELTDNVTQVPLLETCSNLVGSKFQLIDEWICHTCHEI